MTHYNTEETKFHAILSSRISKTIYEQKCKSDVRVTSNPPLGYGCIIEIGWLKKRGNEMYYAITTGNIIKDNGNLYYEVYPEVYNHAQARIISSSLNMMKKADKKHPVKTLENHPPILPEPRLFFAPFRILKNNPPPHTACDFHHAD